MPIIYWTLKMRARIELFREENGSITVEINLQNYLPLFLSINQPNSSLSPAENKAFNAMYQEFGDYFGGVSSEDFMSEIEGHLLQNFSIEEQLELKASPALNLIHNAYTEICKNAIDAFLKQHMDNPSDPSTKIKLNINIIKLFDQVRITFSDSGPGFPKSIHNALNTEKKQLKYAETHQSTQKRAEVIQGLRGMMGGGSRGLREIIALVLSGEPLYPGKKMRRAEHFDSQIHFTNANNPYCKGACIEITTQVAPIPELRMAFSPVTSHEELETTDSESSGFDDTSTHHNKADFSTHSPARQKQTLGLSIDTDRIDTRLFEGDSPLIQKKHPSVKYKEKMNAIVGREEQDKTGLHLSKK